MSKLQFIIEIDIDEKDEKNFSETITSNNSTQKKLAYLFCTALCLSFPCESLRPHSFSIKKFKE